MEVLTEASSRPCAPKGTVVTIGAYDGVHLGHRAVIDAVRRLAAKRGVKSAVVTFDRHPATVVRPASAPRLLTDLPQKLELLEATGVDLALVLRFDEVRAAEPAEQFVKEVLVECLRAGAVVVGEDFHFGHQRRGDVRLLAAMGAEFGFEVVPVELVSAGDGEVATVSSTRIRALLAEGRVDLARALLGRPHEVRGTVVHGDGRGGAVLGFPTANVAVAPEIQLPAEGIYAGWYERPDGSVHKAAISLGRRPTFYPEAATPLLEAHLLGFRGELYGEPARVRFVARLREERKFDSIEELAAQTSRDVDAARALLAG